MAIPWSIETFESLPSTQDIVKDMARSGYPEGAVVQALEQTGGYGRHGRKWISPKGNLYLSLLLKPPGDARHVGQIGLLTGVVLAETVRKYLEDPEIAMLKWPNDLLLDGQKCAGILVETQLTPKNSLSWVAVGIGVNIISSPRDMAESIEKYAAKPFSLNAFRATLLKYMDQYYTLWSREGFEPIREKWLEYAHKKGSKVRVRIGPQFEEGYFYGLDEEGGLLMHDKELRMKKITAGEVYL